MVKIFGYLIFYCFFVCGFLITKAGIKYGIFDGLGEILFGGFFSFIGIFGLIGLLSGCI